MKLFLPKHTLLVCALCFTFNVKAYENLNSSKVYGKDTAFTGANVLNPNLDVPIANATILVSEGKIVKIQPQSQDVPSNYDVVDVSNKWIIPGLIDGHIHMAQSGGAFTRPDTLDATNISKYEKDQNWLLNHTSSILENYLRLGITTVFDMGGPSEYLTHYRQVTSQGIFPDIYAAGALLSPMAVPKLNLNGETFIKVANANEVKNRVREQLALNTNIIKMVWTQETGLTSQQLHDLYKPAMELAKSNNKIIAVHVEDLENAKIAIKAGANILVHGVIVDLIDDEFISLMKNNNVTYMPTLTAYSHYFEWFKNTLQFTSFEQKHSHPELITSFQTLMNRSDEADQMFQVLLKYVPQVDKSDDEIAKLPEQERAIVKQLRSMFSSKIENIQKMNLQKAVDAHVNIAFGTDAGNPGTMHASSMYGELLEWQQAGISNKDILKAVTFGNAQALNLADTLGSLTSGKDANFVVLDANPYKSLKTLSAPAMTIKRGKIAYTNGVEHNETH